MHRRHRLRQTIRSGPRLAHPNPCLKFFADPQAPISLPRTACPLLTWQPPACAQPSPPRRASLHEQRDQKEGQLRSTRERGRGTVARARFAREDNPVLRRRGCCTQNLWVRKTVKERKTQGGAFCAPGRAALRTAFLRTATLGAARTAKLAETMAAILLRKGEVCGRVESGAVMPLQARADLPQIRCRSLPYWPEKNPVAASDWPIPGHIYLHHMVTKHLDTKIISSGDLMMKTPLKPHYYTFVQSISSKEASTYEGI